MLLKNMSSGEVEMLRSIVCPYCSASIETTTYETVVTCPYCGTTFIKGGDVIKDHRMGMVNYSPSQIFRIFKEWALRKPETPDDISAKARFENYRLILYPYWVFNVDLNAFYRAKKKGFMTEGSEMETLTVSVPANRGMEGTMLSDYEFSLRGKIFYNSQVVKKFNAKILNADVDVEEAKRKALNRTLNYIKKKLEKIGLEAIKFTEKSKAKIAPPTYVHIPVYVMNYSYAGKRYKFLADASDSRIIYAEIPTGKVFRMISAGAAFASLIFAGLVFLVGLGLRATCFAAYSGFLILLISGFMFYKAATGVIVVKKYKEERDIEKQFTDFIVKHL